MGSSKENDTLEKEAKRLDYAMDLNIIGVLDDSEDSDVQKYSDRLEALGYINRDEEIPYDLLQRILKYKEEDKLCFDK